MANSKSILKFIQFGKYIETRVIPASLGSKEKVDNDCSGLSPFYDTFLKLQISKSIFIIDFKNCTVHRWISK